MKSDLKCLKVEYTDVYFLWKSLHIKGKGHLAFSDFYVRTRMSIY